MRSSRLIGFLVESTEISGRNFLNLSNFSSLPFLLEGRDNWEHSEYILDF